MGMIRWSMNILTIMRRDESGPTDGPKHRFMHKYVLDAYCECNCKSNDSQNIGCKCKSCSHCEYMTSTWKCNGYHRIYIFTYLNNNAECIVLHIPLLRSAIQGWYWKHPPNLHFAIVCSGSVDCGIVTPTYRRYPVKRAMSAMRKHGG